MVDKTSDNESTESHIDMTGSQMKSVLSNTPSIAAASAIAAQKSG